MSASALKSKLASSQGDELVSQALTLMDQAPFGWNPLRMPDLQYGVSFTRYNRIEGLSTGVLATRLVP